MSSISLSSNNICAIYILKDPITLEIRYVGKSKTPFKRFKEHLYRARKGNKTYVYTWIRKILKLGNTPILEILEYTDNWIEREIYWISYYKRTNKLTNLSEGGEGSLGYKHTKGWKELSSKRMKGNKIMIGKKHSEKTK